MPSRGAPRDLKSIAKDLTALVAPVRQFDRPALEGEMVSPSGTRLIVVTRNGFTGETPRNQDSFSIKKYSSAEETGNSRTGGLASQSRRHFDRLRQDFF
jgi:hypothetical protein